MVSSQKAKGPLKLSGHALQSRHHLRDEQPQQPLPSRPRSSGNGRVWSSSPHREFGLSLFTLSVFSFYDYVLKTIVPFDAF